MPLGDHVRVCRNCDRVVPSDFLEVCQHCERGCCYECSAGTEGSPACSDECAARLRVNAVRKALDALGLAFSEVEQCR